MLVWYTYSYSTYILLIGQYFLTLTVTRREHVSTYICVITIMIVNCDAQVRTATSQTAKFVG